MKSGLNRNFLNKKSLILIFSVLFLALIPITESSFDFNESNDKPEDKLKEYNGYIVEFKEEPLLAKEKELKNSVITDNRESHINAPVDTSNYNRELEEHKNKIEIEHINFKSRLSNVLNEEQINKKKSLSSAPVDEYSPNDKIIKEYKNAFNGVVLNLTSEEDVEKIKKFPEVKNVYPNHMVYADLMDSVSLINADDAWRLDKYGNNCLESGEECLTGKDVKIGIIDTGVDYTHPELGRTIINERNLEKITNDNLDLFFSNHVDQSISMDNDRIAYYSDDKIYIYSFQTKQITNIITMLSNETTELKVDRLSLKGNYVVYFAVNNGNSENYIFLYDLNTGEHKQIASGIRGVGYIFISDDKIVYSASRIDNNDDVRSNIFIYDIKTGNDTAILNEDNELLYLPSVSNNLIAYSTDSENGCYDGVIYDMNANLKQIIKPAELGVILDFKDDKLFYMACNDYSLNFGTYYLYDIKTGEYTKIGLNLEEKETNASDVDFMWITYWIIQSKITDDLIFFSKDFGANSIMAYDMNQKRYVQINIIKPTGDFDAIDNKVCFVSTDKNIYCHDYDVNDSYELPQNIFNEKVIDGYDFVNNDNDPMDDNGHGTHVAATAGGKANDVLLHSDIVNRDAQNSGGGGGGGILQNGLNGIAPDAKIVAYKVLNNFGSGYFSDVIAAIERSVDPNQDYDYSDHLDIISLSLGSSYGDPDDPVSQAIDNAASAGVVAVIAAGNSGSEEQTIGSPGKARKAITVGASDKNDSIASFSSRGPVIWDDNAIIKPDIVAPGVNICAAKSVQGGFMNRDCYNDDKHIALSGTSMATPHVSGAAALLKQKNPDWSPEEIKMALRSKAVSLNYDINTQGYGRLDILNAINFRGIPSIAEVKSNYIARENFDIVGTAKGRDFDNYVLYYGKGANPTEWEMISEGDNPVDDDLLFPNFNISQLNGGLNVLRLVVSNNEGEISEDRNFVFVDNLILKEPKNNDVYRLGDRLNIIGTVTGDFDYYKIEYSSDDISWYDNGILLVNNGIMPIEDGVIANWDTSSLQDSGYFSLRVSMYKNEKIINSKYIWDLHLDKTLRSGWPQIIKYDFIAFNKDKENNIDVKAVVNENNKIISIFPEGLSKLYEVFYKSNIYWDRTRDFYGDMNAERDNNGKEEEHNIFRILNKDSLNGYYVWPGILEPVVDDVDNNGEKEIFVFVGGIHAKIYGFKQNGSYLQGWPVEIPDDYLESSYVAAPSISDVDKDGKKEILVYGSDSIYIYKYDGVLLRKLFLGYNAYYPSEISVADIDNDRNKEIIKEYIEFNESIMSQKIGVLDQYGKMRKNWPKNTFSEDVLNKKDGKFTYCGDFGGPVVGDLDSDGIKEIIAMGLRNIPLDSNNDTPHEELPCKSRLYAYKADGSLFNGFPIDLDGFVFFSPIIADVNNDSFNEIIVSITSFNPDNKSSGVFIFDRFGKVLSGWPKMTDTVVAFSPSIIDVNNDGYLEILVQDLKEDTAGIYLFDHNGKLRDGWPVKGAFISRNVLSGDVNGDNIPDVIAASPDRIYAWNNDGSLIDGFPKSTEESIDASLTIDDLNNDGKIELIGSSNENIDSRTWERKNRGSIYVWDLNSNYNKKTIYWPMFLYDSSHTGNYPGQIQSLPDLKITNMKLPFCSLGNKRLGIQFQATISNTGVKASSQTKLLIKHEKINSNYNNSNSYYYNVPKLNPKQSIIIKAQCLSPQSTVENIKTTLFVDPFNQVRELYEGNNYKTTAFVTSR